MFQDCLNDGSAMFILTSLLIAHFVADFYLQPHAWVMDKVQHREKSLGLFKHICVHFVLTLSAILLFVGTYSWEIWLGFVFIILSHYAIDIWKTYQSFKIKYFLIDQVGHYAVIAGVTMWWLSVNNIEFRSPTFFFETHLWVAIFAGLFGLVFLYKPVALTQILVLNALNLESNPNYQFDVQSIFRRVLVFLSSITLTPMFIILDMLIRALESYFKHRQEQNRVLIRKQIAVTVFNTFCVTLAYVYFAQIVV